MVIFHSYANVDQRLPKNKHSKTWDFDEPQNPKSIDWFKGKPTAGYGSQKSALFRGVPDVTNEYLSPH